MLAHTLRLVWQKIKRNIEWAILWTFDTIVLSKKKANPNTSTIVIVQLKLIGDYILWSPYGKALARHSIMNGKRVTLIVNSAVQALAKKNFPDCAVLGIDRKDFLSSFSKRAGLLTKLRELGATVTYHDTHPRDFIIEDTTIRALGAPAWGFDATFSDRPWIDCWLSRRLYTNFLPAMDSVHQSLRHRAFLQAVGVPEDYLYVLSDFAADLDRPPSPPYFIICPGASLNEKRWPTSNFIKIAQRILEKHPEWHCIVLGTKNEKELGHTLAQALGAKASNLAGDTDLPSFVGWIAHAKLVIGNDSAACHIAAACGTLSFSIVGGGHPGWFFPYPEESLIQCPPIAITNSMSCFGCNWICCHRVRKREPFPCIAEIQPDQVWKEVEKALAPYDRPSIEGTPNANHSTDS